MANAQGLVEEDWESRSKLAILALSHEEAALNLPMALQRIAIEKKMPPLQTLRDFLSLSFGPGRVSFADYVRLRLFDRDYWQGDRRAVVGQRRNRDLALEVNYRHDWLGMLSNKVAEAQYLSAYGLPTIPFQAVYAPHSASDAVATGSRRGLKLLRDGEDLRQFLLNEAEYPLFGKPVEGVQSLGAIAFAKALPDENELERRDGTRVALDRFVADVTENYASGYVFQPCLAPHPEFAKAFGSALATARIVTIRTPDGPRIFRASLKIPVGGNEADNFWRAGNILAALDVEHGDILGAVSGVGFALKRIETHPGTGAAVKGAVAPHWSAMKAAALEGARLMRHMGLIGWDVAGVEQGAVIVEMNATPDLILSQLAHRQGALDADFNAFVDYRKSCAQAHLARISGDTAKL